MASPSTLSKTLMYKNNENGLSSRDLFNVQSPIPPRFERVHHKILAGPGGLHRNRNAFSVHFAKYFNGQLNHVCAPTLIVLIKDFVEEKSHKKYSAYISWHYIFGSYRKIRLRYHLFCSIWNLRSALSLHRAIFSDQFGPLLSSASISGLHGIENLLLFVPTMHLTCLHPRKKTGLCRYKQTP